jgi:hypothetical protein
MLSSEKILHIRESQEKSNEKSENEKVDIKQDSKVFSSPVVAWLATGGTLNRIEFQPDSVNSIEHTVQLLNSICNGFVNATQLPTIARLSSQGKRFHRIWFHTFIGYLSFTKRRTIYKVTSRIR